MYAILHYSIFKNKLPHSDKPICVGCGFFYDALYKVIYKHPKILKRVDHNHLE